MKRGSWKTISLGVLALTLAIPAQAELITFTFGGTITEVQDNNNFVGGALSVGDSFSGSYAFESDSPDYRPGNPTFGGYFALLGICGQVGYSPYEYTCAGGVLTVSDGFGSPPHDGYELGTTVEIDNRVWELRIDLTDYTASVWSSDALPEEPPDLDLFSSSRFRLHLESEDVELIGTVTYLVPEPSSVLLLIVGVAALWPARRSRD